MSRACQKTEKLLSKCFSGAFLSARQAEAVLTHVRTCAECQGLFDRLAMASRLAAGLNANDAQPSAWELSLFSARLFARTTPATSRAMSPRMLWAMAGAAVAGVVVVLAVLPARAPPLVEEWHARSLATPPLAVRPLCQTTDSTGAPVVRSLSEDPAPQEMSACPRDGWIHFAYQADRGGFINVLSDSGSHHTWHWPPAAPQRVELNKRLSRLPLTLSPGLETEGGDWQVVFVFAEDKLSEDLLRRAVAAPQELQLPVLSVIKIHISISAAREREGVP